MQIAMTMRNALMENVNQAVLMMIIVKKEKTVGMVNVNLVVNQMKTVVMGIDVYIENASMSVSPKGTVK